MNRVAIAASISPGEARQLDRKLRSLWRRKRWYAHVRGAAAMLLALAVLVLAGLLIDWLVALPPMSRALLLAGTVAVVAGVGFRRWWTHLRRFDPRLIALEAQRYYPELGSSLIAYVDLGRHPDGSRQLVDAARQRAIHLAKPLCFDQLVSFRRLRGLTLAAAGALALVVGVGLTWPAVMATFAQRMINPFSDLAYPTRTTVTLLDAMQIVPQSAAVTLVAEVRGVRPAEARLNVRSEGTARWETMRLAVDRQGRVTRRFPSLDGGIEYYFRAGDGRSTVGEVQVIPPPRIRQAEVTLDYPAYTGLGVEKNDSLNVRAPEGTQVHWRLALDRPVAAALMLPLDAAGETAGTSHTFQLTGDGMVALLSLPVQSWRYRLRWTVEVEGLDRPLTFDAPVHYQFQALPDMPPRVQILRPARRAQIATLNGRIPLAFGAADDHGLSQAWIVYRRGEADAEHRLLMAEFSSRSITEHVFDWQLRETVEGLQVGETLEYTVEVVDNRDGADGRQSGRAAPWRSVEILSEEVFLERMTELQLEEFDRLRRVREDVSESLYQVERIEEETPPSTSKDTGP